jgi:polar amino acid transport system substrate-binding protein
MYATKKSGIHRLWASIALVAALVGMTGLTSGAAQRHAHSSTTLNTMLPSAIRQSGVLTVASSIGYPPYEFYASNGKTYEGLDIDLINAVGKALGVKVKITDTRFSNIFPTMEANRYDLAISAFAATPQFSKYLTFVNYIGNGSVGFIVSSTNTTVQPNDPTSLCGATMGVAQGETYQTPYINAVSATCTSEGKAPVTVKTFAQSATILLAIESGQVTVRDAVPAVGVYDAKHATGLKFVPNVVPAMSVGNPPDGIAIPKDDTKLVTAVQAALTSLVRDGAYHKILVKWGVTENQLSKITVTK